MRLRGAQGAAAGAEPAGAALLRGAVLLRRRREVGRQVPPHEPDVEHALVSFQARVQPRILPRVLAQRLAALAAAGLGTERFLALPEKTCSALALTQTLAQMTARWASRGARRACPLAGRVLPQPAAEHLRVEGAVEYALPVRALLVQAFEQRPRKALKHTIGGHARG